MRQFEWTRIWRIGVGEDPKAVAEVCSKILNMPFDKGSDCAFIYCNGFNRPKGFEHLLDQVEERLKPLRRFKRVDRRPVYIEMRVNGQTHYVYGARFQRRSRRFEVFK